MSGGYFSWQNFNELANIDSHLVFAQHLLGKYQWDTAVKKSLEQQIAQIHTKQQDSKLNISVIGEFSSGKSTFINALLRFDLLAIDVLQGTTIAITIMEYSPKMFIKVDKGEGHAIKYAHSTIESLRTQLQELTTNSTFGRDIKTVTVGLPSPTLKAGFRIIDTPGTNSRAQWHEDVTRRAISDISDMSIVVVDANRPMPQTLCNFVEDNLMDVINNCIFVLNKIDLVKANERSQMVKYVEAKIKDEFSIDHTIVLPYTSLEVVNTFVPGTLKISDDSLLEQSIGSERRLLNHAGEQKAITQAKKLISLTRQMYNNLSSILNDTQKQLKSKSELLDRSRCTDLKPFIESEKNQRLKALRMYTRDYRADLDYNMSQKMSSSISLICKEIEKLGNLDNMKAYMENRLSESCKRESKKMISQSNNTYKELITAYRNEVQIFRRNFENQFKDLRILDIRFSPVKEKLPVQKIIDNMDFNQATEFVKDELSKENWKLGGGIAAGAAIGSMIMPGIGTVIGGFIGGIFGAGSTEKDAKMRQDLIAKVRPTLNSYLVTIKIKVLSNLDDYINDMEKSLLNEINAYLTQYRQTVDRKITEWQKSRTMLDSNIRDLQADIQIVNSKRRSIESVMAAMEKR